MIVGNNELKINSAETVGKAVLLDGEYYFKIENYSSIPPFFMSIVSDSDHWMFISSNGALSAGRKNPDDAIFPYYTNDKITDSPEITGSKTLIVVEKEGKKCLWEPFSTRYENQYEVIRNLYKNVYGNRLIFEEQNADLGLSFQYSWCNSDRFGFVKKSVITNISPKAQKIELLDGVQNILPFGVGRVLQNTFSPLVDAYKKNELITTSGIGIFCLSSILTDQAEPSEALRATTVWSTGMGNCKKLLSSKQLDTFRSGSSIQQEEDVRAARGAYFNLCNVELAIGGSKTGYIVIESSQDVGDITALDTYILETKDAAADIEKDIAKGTENLIQIVANADGLQLTEDVLTTSRHFSNVLFNVMRGGIFDNNYRIEKNDFIRFIEKFNKPLSLKQKSFIDALSPEFEYEDLLVKAHKTTDGDLIRVCYEYMPLTFSRRHGDPSRPWNLFSIDIKKEDGSKVLHYAGNWRDIFQNWETLSISFPEYMESMISKFVNASTADGYNPYRVTRDGIDWEVIDPDEPWSNIGYWGDHQIIYLLKFLENSKKFHPGKLNNFLHEDIFVYANVPYRIKPYEQLLSDPHSTITFDNVEEKRIEERVKFVGSDGKLVWTSSGEIYKANLSEKLLVPLLSKLTNFIPEAGIWMNTQRPEWNDANNALVGYGVSMVTLYYMRRYISFCKELFVSGDKTVKISKEVVNLMGHIESAFANNISLLEGKITDKDRKKITDLLGKAGENYRERLYNSGFSGTKVNVSAAQLAAFFDISLAFIDHSICANKRADKLYHAYNLMKVEKGNEISIRHLYEMLEGQVSVLSSGLLTPTEALEVLDALKASKMFRPDQYSYMLYPDRQLPRFMQRNNIPADLVTQSKLITKLLADKNQELVLKDVKGNVHFNASFRNNKLLKKTLDGLKGSTYGELVAKEYQLILDIYEKIFDHQSFTGRSGTFYGYEGLGSIYWHMVSKLVLAAEENYFKAYFSHADAKITGRLADHYFESQAGVGVKKSPALYGAFPTDPYSHTPKGAGAQQPGMTGQVKEDILSRMSELGVHVNEGKIQFNPALLRKEEFLSKPGSFDYRSMDGQKKTLPLAAGSLAFTVCQIPVIYVLGTKAEIEIMQTSKSKTTIEGKTIDASLSRTIFQRKHDIEYISVMVVK